MRPISVITTFWRGYASARLKSASAVAWRRTWVPEDSWGGRKGADVYSLRSLNLSMMACAWGLLTTAWIDHVSPALLCGLMKHLDCLVGLADMLLALWGRQERYLQLHGCTARQPLRYRKATLARCSL
eukprot:s3308_g10.t1